MTAATIPEGALVEVTLTIRMPCSAAPDQLDEWLAFEVGGGGTLRNDNPLREHERESWGGKRPQWRDTGLRGRSERSKGVKRADGAIYYTERHWGEPR